MERNYIMLILFAVGIVLTTIDLIRNKSKYKQFHPRRLFIENKVLYLVICIYMLVGYIERIFQISM